MKSIAVIGNSFRGFNHMVSFLKTGDKTGDVKLIFVQKVDDIRGRKFIGIIRMFDCYDLKDYQVIYELTKKRIRP